MSCWSHTEVFLIFSFHLCPPGAERLSAQPYLPTVTSACVLDPDTSFKSNHKAKFNALHAISIQKSGSGSLEVDFAAKLNVQKPPGLTAHVAY